MSIFISCDLLSVFLRFGESRRRVRPAAFFGCARSPVAFPVASCIGIIATNSTAATQASAIQLLQEERFQMSWDGPMDKEHVGPFIVPHKLKIEHSTHSAHGHQPRAVLLLAVLQPLWIDGRSNQHSDTGTTS